MRHSISYNRRSFLNQLMTISGMVMVPVTTHAAKKRRQVMTVNGLIDSSAMGQTLPHEHILVDSIGAADVNPPRWDRDHVMEKVIPYLQEARNAGCRTFIDCTPNYLGRDVGLLKQLSAKCDLHIITNTGYYGGSNHKFLPDHFHRETAEQLSRRWQLEWHRGIDNTPIKPGFIKISVSPEHLSDISFKLIQAAALTHLKTGLTIVSHTGASQPAFEQIEVLKSRRVDPAAFIWVHAQREDDPGQYVRAVREGAWVSLDGIRENNIDQYVSKLLALKQENCLHRVLLSHDAGWYKPDNPDSDDFAPYTTLFRKMIPALEHDGFTEKEIMQIIVNNPAEAFTIGVKKLRRKRS